MSGPVRVDELESGGFWRVVLDAPKGNVLDATMTEALTEVFGRAGKARGLRAVCLEGAGNDFSFGASVAEHAPGEVDKMLPRFHALFRTMLEAQVPLLAAVRGRCLGGGLELAAFCHRVFAAPDAKLGQPEIVLGVFAPVASLVLPARLGHGAAADLLLSGRTLGAPEAHALRLVDELAEDPSQAALAWARAHLLEHSAQSLRHAVRAFSIGSLPLFAARLEELEHLYLRDLMATQDAKEGIGAFLDKRQARWSDQ